LFRELGRVQEVEPLLASFAEMFPGIGVNLRSAQAVVFADQRRLDEARAIFDELAENDFAGFPANLAWIFSIAFLAEVCAVLHDAERAAVLYELLRPYSARNVTIGNVLVFGAAARYLGMLAITLQRWDDAARWFEDAIAMNTRTGMRHALAHSQTDYAAMLLARLEAGAEQSNPERCRAKALELLNRAISTAHELGMKPLVEQALALKLRAQGASSGALLSSIDALTLAVQHDRPDVRPHAGPDGTVTLMFSDMEGFTAMTERLGDLRAHQVIAAHNKIVREQVAAHRGFELELQGDGFLLAFATPRQALACAVAIQRAMTAYNAQHPDEPIRVRIGLHAGEVIQEGDKFFGKTVILAARIAAQARGGEILVSDRVKVAGDKADGPRFGEARTVALKGLSGSYALYPVEWQTSAG
jgi:class 3 adenylate cyclase